MHVKRVTGGHTEVVMLRGHRDVESILGVPFEVPDAIGAALVEDGSGRFEAHDALKVGPADDVPEPGVAGEP